MNRRRTVYTLFALLLAAAFSGTGGAYGQGCPPEWDVDFGAAGADRVITSFATFDDGTGSALYAGGYFTTIGGQPAAALARWDGRQWTEVGGGLYSDGSIGSVSSLRVWDDGRGPALYVGGTFTDAGTAPIMSIARWDGRNWESLGEGTSGFVTALGSYDDGRGEALYVAGRFTEAGGQSARNIARWDGHSWEALGEGVANGTDPPTSFAVFDDGGGPKLYVGGFFWAAGGINATLLARWDGHNWEAVPGADFDQMGGGGVPHVDGLQVFDDGHGPALFLTGHIWRHRTPAPFLRWDGQTWTTPGGGVEGAGGYHPDAITIFDDGSGPALWIAGGQFRYEGREDYTTIARWDGDSYFSPPDATNDWVWDMLPFNDGFTQALYLGGDFDRLLPSREPLGGLVRWGVPHAALMHTPLRAGHRASFTTTCSTPGQRVNFIYSTTGLGSLYVPQLGVTLDLDRPHLAGFGIADAQGKAELSRTLPPDSSGRTIWMQAAEQGRKSEVVEGVVE